MPNVPPGSCVTARVTVIGWVVDVVRRAGVDNGELDLELGERRVVLEPDVGSCARDPARAVRHQQPVVEGRVDAGRCEAGVDVSCTDERAGDDLGSCHVGRRHHETSQSLLGRGDVEVARRRCVRAGRCGSECGQQREVSDLPKHRASRRSVEVAQLPEHPVPLFGCAVGTAP